MDNVIKPDTQGDHGTATGFSQGLCHTRRARLEHGGGSVERAPAKLRQNVVSLPTAADGRWTVSKRCLPSPRYTRRARLIAAAAVSLRSKKNQ
jgi:hypothetical protein